MAASVKGCFKAEPGADSGAYSGLYSWRPVCQYRPRLQLDYRYQNGLKAGRYAITEAGFGADLGAEKFLDIKCRMAELKRQLLLW